MRGVIGLSTFSWIGNHYSIIGYRADPSTERWWQSLRRRIAKMAVKIPSSGRLTSNPKDVWAFPAALEQIRRGRKRGNGT